MVNHKSLLSLVYILGLFFQHSNCLPLDSDNESINDAGLYHRTTSKVADTSSKKKTTPATTTERVCIAAANRGPKPKLNVWPVAEESSSRKLKARGEEVVQEPEFNRNGLLGTPPAYSRLTPELTMALGEVVGTVHLWDCINDTELL